MSQSKTSRTLSASELAAQWRKEQTDKFGDSEEAAKQWQPFTQWRMNNGFEEISHQVWVRTSTGGVERLEHVVAEEAMMNMT